MALATKRIRIPKVEQAQGVVLGIDLTVVQEQDNWCWAACTKVAVGFRGVKKQQCDVASSVPRLSGNNCCQSPPSCDVGLSDAEITPLFFPPTVSTYHKDVVSAATLKKQLKAGNLTGVGITWLAGAGGHMLLVYGFSGSDLLVYDPKLGHGPLSYSELVNYDSFSGLWESTWEDL